MKITTMKLIENKILIYEKYLCQLENAKLKNEHSNAAISHLTLLPKRKSNRTQTNFKENLKQKAHICTLLNFNIITDKEWERQ